MALAYAMRTPSVPVVDHPSPSFIDPTQNTRRTLLTWLCLPAAGYPLLSWLHSDVYDRFVPVPLPVTIVTVVNQGGLAAWRWQCTCYVVERSQLRALVQESCSLCHSH